MRALITEEMREEREIESSLPWLLCGPRVASPPPCGT